MLANILSRYWWTTLIRGALWIVLGGLVFAQPGLSLVALTLMFGVSVFIDGMGNVLSAVGGREENEHWWVLLLAGLAGIVVGLLTFNRPGLTAVGLLFYIAFWAIGTGFLQLVAALRLRKEIEGEYWLGFAGLASVAFGVFLLMRPGLGVLSVMWLLATYVISFGVMLVALALRVRGFSGRVARVVRG